MATKRRVDREVVYGATTEHTPATQMSELPIEARPWINITD